MRRTGEVSAGGPPGGRAGAAWFDHEWSTSALGPGAVGWDWFSLQLGDERELMFFQIRREDGTLEAGSGGTLVEKDGRTRRLGATRSRSRCSTVGEARRRAPSIRSVAHHVAAAGLALEVDRRLDAQELRTSFTYWEGAVSLAERAGTPSGRGYVEMTGYARSMRGVF